MKKAILDRTLSFLAHTLVRYPAVLPSLPVFLFLLLHMAHLPWWYILGLVLPVGAFVYFALHWLVRIALRRLHQRRLNLLVELALSLPLLLSLYFLNRNDVIPIALFLLLWLGWLVLFAYLRRTGPFYAAFAGLVVFFVVVLAFNLLQLEERLLLGFRSWMTEKANKEQSEDRFRIELKSEEARTYRLLGDGQELFAFTLPHDLFMHRSVPDYKAFPGGIPLLVVSASAMDPYVMPYAIVFLASSASQESLVADLQMTLGHRLNAAEIAGLEFKGGYAYSPKASVQWQGKQWTFADVSSQRNVQCGFFAVEEKGRRYIIYYQSPMTSSFPMHPDLRDLFASLQWSNPLRVD